MQHRMPVNRLLAPPLVMIATGVGTMVLGPADYAITQQWQIGALPGQAPASSVPSPHQPSDLASRPYAAAESGLKYASA
jgi:hypothetical protein